MSADTAGDKGRVVLVPCGRRVWERWWAAGLVAIVAMGLLVVGSSGARAAAPTTPSMGRVSTWADFLCQGDEICGLADVSGDGRADAVAFVRSSQTGQAQGDVWVGVSNGSGFDIPAKWSESFCLGDESCLLGDVNNDGRADAVQYGKRFLSNVWVALSTGAGFAAPVEWSSVGCGFQRGEQCQLADVNNDDRADLVAFVTSPSNPSTHGDVFVSLSTGTGFANQVQWAESACMSSLTCQMGDVNGDGRADLLTFVKSTQLGSATGDVLVSLSTGSGFSPSTRWADWACLDSQVCEVGDVNGDGRTDLVTFNRPAGTSGDVVWVALSTGSGFSAGIQTAREICEGAQVCLAGDVDGDEQADAVAFVKSTRGGAVHADIQVTLTTRMPAPVLAPLTVTGNSVSLSWTDRSVSEDGFDVVRRITPSGSLQAAGQVPTRSRPQLSGAYSFTDTIQPGQRACYHIKSRNGRGGSNFSNEVCTSPLTLPTAPTPRPAGDISLPDSVGGAAGVDSSVAIGTDGLPIIAHRNVDGSQLALRVSHCEDQACTAATHTNIDVARDVGRWSSIKLGVDGLPLISYWATGNDLKVAHCENVACTSATLTTVDSAANVSGWTSLTIGGDGLGLITYFDTSSGTSAVKVAHCLNVACTSSRVSTVEAVRESSPDSDRASVATGPLGFGVVTYNSESDLRVAACTNADCSTAIRTTVDTASDTETIANATSIAVGKDGLPLISYAAAKNQAEFSMRLKIAHCVNIYCTDATATEVESDGSFAWLSLTVGSDGLGVMAYREQKGQDLKVAHCVNVECSATTTTFADAFDDTGRRPTIAIGADGLPVIAYQGPGPNGLTLRVMRCANVDCTGVLVAPF